MMTRHAAIEILRDLAETDTPCREIQHTWSLAREMVYQGKLEGAIEVLSTLYSHEASEGANVVAAVCFTEGVWE